VRPHLKLCEKFILKIVQRHIEERGILNASQFSFHSRHSWTFQCMSLKDYAILNFNNNMSKNAVFFDIEKVFDTSGTWASYINYRN
jgi:hypothetical protein